MAIPVVGKDEDMRRLSLSNRKGSFFVFVSLSPRPLRLFRTPPVRWASFTIILVSQLDRNVRIFRGIEEIKRKDHSSIGSAVNGANSYEKKYLLNSIYVSSTRSVPF